ncbi:MAG TPA: DUF11 domain-containing protein, partial [Gammaproteobacteria bacterium]
MSSSHTAITLQRRPWRLLAGLFLAMAGLLSTVQSYAACSSGYVDQVYLNEYYFGTDLNFLEVYIPNNNKVAAGASDSWSIRVYDAADSYTDYSLDSSNPYTNICTFGSKTFITHDVPGGLPGTGKAINAVLLDGNGDEIDYLKFSQQSPITEYVSPQCTYGPTHDIDLEIPNYGNKDVARFPDGRGEWSISSLTGANTSYSQCTSNDAGITKSVSDAAIVVNTLASFTLQVSNPGKQAVEAVSVSESWPAELSYDNHSTTAGSYDHNSGVWTIGTLDKETTASLTINFFGDTPGSYTNVATLTYTDNKTSYTVDDYAIAEIVPAPVSGPHHLRLLHTGSGLTCTPAAVTLQACADADCTTLYGDTVTATLSPAGWVGGNTVSFSGGQVELALRHTTAESVTLAIDSAAPAPMNPTQCYLSGVAGNCDMLFHDSGFAFDVPTVTAC